jgi:hypothetical protein
MILIGVPSHQGPHLTVGVHADVPIEQNIPLTAKNVVGGHVNDPYLKLSVVSDITEPSASGD